MSNMTPGFIKIPPLEISPKDEIWILTGPCIYQSALIGEDGEPVLVEVPAGFETDLASIPRLFRLLIVKNGRHRPAAIVHDYLCRLGKNFPRSLADKIFLEAMKVYGEWGVRRHLMYWAVAANTIRLKLIGKAR